MLRTAVFCTAAVIATLSTVSAEPLAWGELISMTTVTEGGNSVQLPTIKKADGSICHSYVFDARRTKLSNGNTEITVTPKEICETTQVHLVSIKSIKRDGLIIQKPRVRVTQ